MRRLSQERGFTLVEVLIAMILMLVILGATLTTLTNYETNASIDRKSKDAQDRSRATLRQLARHLRNVASPTEGERDPIDKATDTDLIFQSVDPQGPANDQNVANIRRVRYCLDTSDPDHPAIRFQHQRWSTAAPPPVPANATCPGTGWTSLPGGSSRVLVSDVVNARAANRPIFLYRATVPGCSTTPITGTCLEEITGIRSKIFVDVNGSGKRPAEVPLETSVALRNQNRPPTAVSSVTPVAPNQFLLNATASVDPEGETLRYEWYIAGLKIGEGAIFKTNVLTIGTHVIDLHVIDSGGITTKTQVSVNVTNPL